MLYKYRLPILIAFLVLLADQALKFYIKLNFYHGETYEIFGEAFRMYFVENEGMAFGWKLAGDYGKIILTVFRIAAVFFIGYYLYLLTNKKAAKGLIISISLIFAGALGNIIDSVFYGVIFSASEPNTGVVATLFPAGGGYAPWLHGKVVDMLSFNLFTLNVPHAVPLMGGKSFTFFGPIFNIADAAITGGVIMILLFQKRYFKDDEEAVEEETKAATETTQPPVPSENIKEDPTPPTPATAVAPKAEEEPDPIEEAPRPDTQDSTRPSGSEGPSQEHLRIV